MHRTRPWRALATSPALLLAISSLAVAQTSPPSTNAQQQARQQSVAPSNDPGARKVLTLADYGRWNRIVAPAIPSDGRWVAYAFQPNDGDPTLFLRQTDGDKSYTIAVGSAPQFSDDARWV